MDIIVHQQIKQTYLAMGQSAMHYISFMHNRIICYMTMLILLLIKYW